MAERLGNFLAEKRQSPEKALRTFLEEQGLFSGAAGEPEVKAGPAAPVDFNRRTGRIRLVTAVRSWVNRVLPAAEMEMLPAKEKPPTTTLQIHQHALVMRAGENHSLGFQVGPGVSAAAVEWSSSDPRVALVNQASVFGLKPGRARVEARVSGALARCEVK